MIWRLTVKFKLKETWAKINGWPNYEVSTYGNVRNVKTGRILKPFVENKQKPYLRVELFNNGKGNKLFVHVLVAKAFLPDTGRNPDGTIMVGHHQINHRDENKKNNITADRFCHDVQFDWNECLCNSWNRTVAGVFFR